MTDRGWWFRLRTENERGNLMSGRNSSSILMACLLAAAFLGIAPIANAAPAGSSFLSAGKGSAKIAIESKIVAVSHGRTCR